MNEFDMIARYFAPLSPDGLKDDAAVLDIPEGRELVVTSDTLNAGTHFFEDDSPQTIAHKALRVNVSDLAAMGADPLCYQMNIAFPAPPQEGWVRAFTEALAADQAAFHIFCSGGDTTTIKGPLSVSITALGTVPRGKAVRRSGVKAGDLIVLTGPVGDAFIGLQILRGAVKTDAPEGFLKALRMPHPHIALSPVLREYAHAGIDVSDGFLADLGHITRASGVKALVALEKIPFSQGAQALVEEGQVTREALLSGGDDYQLILAVPPENLPHLGFPHIVVGRFENGAPAVVVLDQNGAPLPVTAQGWTHF